LFPGIAVAEELRGRGHEAVLLISEKRVDREGTKKYRGLRFETIPAVAKPPTLSPKMLPFLWSMWRTMRRCRVLLRREKAGAVLGMGGFTSLPPVYAGRRAGLPGFVHESNALPGRANRLTARFCTKVFVGMEAAGKHFAGRNVLVTGTPVRLELRELPPRAEAAKAMDLDPARPVLLVTGGSQGARRLNELVAGAARRLPEDWQILHISGAGGEEAVRKAAEGRPGYRVFGFCDRMAEAYAASDMVISRAGASSLTEIAHAGLPAILVPFPFAADAHQPHNARVFADAGAAELVREQDLDEDGLARRIAGILGQPETRESMARAARRLDAPDAAARVCDEIESAALASPA
jgi:UDP-N-acetylglucosamine--N-acetylmuramyl-(pentapeptide) pyrophosphoryl-undecaprenol N-acetylglucosamine transferase